MFEWAKKVASGATTNLSELGGRLRGGQAGLSGLVDGTHVVTAQGWKPVDTLQVGDFVLTFDNGLQPVAAIHHEEFAPAPSETRADRSAILVPAGALRNRRPLWLMPDLGILVESDIALEDTGDPFAIVPGKALAGHRGIAPGAAEAPLGVTKLGFGEEEVIYVEGGMLVHCPASTDMGTADDDAQAIYKMMEFRAAKFMVACQMDGSEPEGLTYGPEELAGIMAGARAGH